MKRVAIIGAGISGLTAAYCLKDEYDITVFESNSYIGGHTHTHEIQTDNGNHYIDTGFIVFNKKTYPNFIKLLEHLKVIIQETTMSFSVACEKTNFEYNGTTFNSLFAQRKNLFNPMFYRFIWGIKDFNSKAKEFLNSKKNKDTTTLLQFFDTNGIKDEVIKYYLIPMTAAVWSTDPQDVLNLPAHFILRFFENHGFLEINDRPEWYTIKGGSNQYVKKLTKDFSSKIKLNNPVETVTRNERGVLIDGETFDHVIFATHSNITMKILKDISADESNVLSMIPYTKSEVLLHHDESFLPKSKLAKAAWNYALPAQKVENGGPTVTYWMNELQRLQCSEQYLVTLNPHRNLNTNSIIKELSYEHPLFNQQAPQAQKNWDKINGQNNTYFCGAYWRNGFHEDGVVSALNVVESLRVVVPWKS